MLEDEPDQAEIMLGWLREAGHHVCHFSRVQDCRNELRRESFDLLILDWMLPDGSGIELLRWLRAQDGGRHDPVIFVTAKDEERDTVAALNAGADDYLPKPVRRYEFLARIEALRRRASPLSGAAAMNYPPYRFDFDKRQCFLSGGKIDLTDKEFGVAAFLFRNIGKLMSRQHILETVWGVSAEVSTRTVDTHISRLRIKLAIRPENGFKLASVYNFGYRLEPVSAVN